ncbi:MAG: DHHA2 domain-containing protein, partial [Burkholderiaceae bacterium]
HHQEILEALKAKKAQDGLNLIFFAVVDILKSESFLLIVGPEEQQIAQSVYGGAAENGVVPLPGFISRKKQMLPPLITFLKARAETRY